MKRSFGIGDILFCLGWILMLAFIIICFVTVKSYKGNAWPLVNGIIIAVLIVGDGGLFAYSLFNPKVIKIQYIFAGFIILLHIANLGIPLPYGVGHPGMQFYVFTGALLIGVGTYLAQEGAGAIIGGPKTTTATAKKKKD
ncbi:MAG: hypothetical protein DRP79_09975 [Planctomycetota bacterium]|nr:MAG: hypothetical protein DRP79_09975 [Planctomycetota bacterium]